jgi:hypothetical protein
MWLLEMNGEPLDSLSAYEEALSGVEAGEVVRLYVAERPSGLRRLIFPRTR